MAKKKVYGEPSGLNEVESLEMFSQIVTDFSDKDVFDKSQKQLKDIWTIVGRWLTQSNKKNKFDYKLYLSRTSEAMTEAGKEIVQRYHFIEIRRDLPKNEALEKAVTRDVLEAVLDSEGFTLYGTTKRDGLHSRSEDVLLASKEFVGSRYDGGLLYPVFERLVRKMKTARPRDFVV